MTRQEILATAIDRWGRESQEDVCIEECSELIKALIKNRRNGGATLGDVIDEIADVQIMLDQMQMIYGSTADAEDRKIERLKGRLGL